MGLGEQDLPYYFLGPFVHEPSCALVKDAVTVSLGGLPPPLCSRRAVKMGWLMTLMTIFVLKTFVR